MPPNIFEASPVLVGMDDPVLGSGPSRFLVREVATIVLGVVPREYQLAATRSPTRALLVCSVGGHLAVLAVLRQSKSPKAANRRRGRYRMADIVVLAHLSEEGVHSEVGDPAILHGTR